MIQLKEEDPQGVCVVSGGWLFCSAGSKTAAAAPSDSKETGRRACFGECAWEVWGREVVAVIMGTGLSIPSVYTNSEGDSDELPRMRLE